MTDLERVRKALGGIYRGEQERPGVREAYEDLDAHLKEDADADEAALGVLRKMRRFEAELAELRGRNRLYVERYQRVEAALTNKVTELAELREENKRMKQTWFPPTEEIDGGGVARLRALEQVDAEAEVKELDAERNRLRAELTELRGRNENLHRLYNQAQDDASKAAEDYVRLRERRMCRYGHRLIEEKP